MRWCGRCQYHHLGRGHKRIGLGVQEMRVPEGDPIGFEIVMVGWYWWGIGRCCSAMSCHEREQGVRSMRCLERIVFRRD